MFNRKHQTRLPSPKFLLMLLIFTPFRRREWADPGGTAIPGQPVEKSEQAPASSPSSKNQFNIDVPRWGDVSDIKLIRTDTFFFSFGIHPFIDN